MRKYFFLAVLLLVSFINAFANGVCIVDAELGTIFKLVSSNVDVTIENQVAITRTTQVFVNDLGAPKLFKYAFPLSENESATGLRWNINNEWLEASIAPTPQDTTLPGGGGTGGELAYNLQVYLGPTPLYFDIETEILNGDSIIFELSYVNLLPYAFGNVNYTYPNDYSLIQSSYLNEQILNLSINSERTISDIALLSHTPDTLSNEGQHAYLSYSSYESPASHNYDISYSLSLDELGLFGLSTLIADTLAPDNGPGGFFVFVAEPDPSENTTVLNKVFTLIIDRSGSMNGEYKMEQARNAATFIINNLNEGDMFNIVDFSTTAVAFRPQHVPFNSLNQSLALTYISNLVASGSTNISDAFSVAIPQFSAVNDSTANIIVFFTDGEANEGIADTNGILEHVSNLVSATETNLLLFTFGIGSDANHQLLTILATQNNGLAVFLGSDEVESVITNFYLMIQNPVLINTQMSFFPNVIIDTYPTPLPNLYKGQQLIVSGRYSEAVTTTITLSGEAFGQAVEYEYELSLSDSTNDDYQFLTKIWAKKKIENLLVLYYSLDPFSEEALALKEEIIDLSVNFGVITPFTSFDYDPIAIKEVITNNIISPDNFQILGNYPNPFNGQTRIKLKINTDLHDIVRVAIYNSLGQLVRTLYTTVAGTGVYVVFWDGLFEDGQLAPTGTYFYIVDFGSTLLGGKMTLLK